MTLIEKFKQYPPALWALALYLCSLGFNLKYDVPLAIFAMVSIYAFSNVDHHVSFIQTLKKHGVLLGFLLATILVTLASRNVGHSLSAQIQWLPGLLIYFAVITYADQPRSRNFVVVSVILTALLAQTAFLAQALYLSDVPDRLEKMWVIKSPLLVAPNDVLYFTIWTPLAAYLMLGQKNRTLKVLGILYLGVTITVSIYMQSRQAVGICLVSLCMLVFLWRPKAGTWVLVGGLILVFAVDWFTGKGLLGKLLYLFPRRYVWDSAWQMFLDKPWLGHGPGMFKVFYEEYLVQAGYALSDVEDRRPMNWAHSLYLEQLSERGLVGLTALMLLIGACIKGLFAQGIRAGSLETSLLVCWTAFLMAGIAESSLLRLWAVTTLLILAGLSATQNTQKDYKKRFFEANTI